jgi:hypothetical protein
MREPSFVDLTWALAKVGIEPGLCGESPDGLVISWPDEGIYCYLTIAPNPSDDCYDINGQYVICAPRLRRLGRTKTTWICPNVEATVARLVSIGLSNPGTVSRSPIVVPCPLSLA